MDRCYTSRSHGNILSSAIVFFFFQTKMFILNVKYEKISFHTADVLIWLRYRLLMFLPPI